MLNTDGAGTTDKSSNHTLVNKGRELWSAIEEQSQLGIPVTEIVQLIMH